MKNVMIDGIEYEPVEKSGDIRIVILQRGWIMVGRLERNGSDCKLHNAAVLRKWGTTKGLGEIASNGPLSDTILDKTNGLVEFDYLTVVATIICQEEKWKEKL
jgi:hypothetical protein